MACILISDFILTPGSYSGMYRNRPPAHPVCLKSRRRNVKVVHRLCEKHQFQCVQSQSGIPVSVSGETRAEADLPRRYNVMLALIVRFLAFPDKKELHNFLQAKPEAISIPFLWWLADQESNAVGEQKRVLSGICEELVRFREQVESDRMDALYADTLMALTEGDVDPDAAAMVLATNPDQYATKLAQRVTGTPVITEGFDPVYNVLLKVAPPAALTPEGIAKSHELARDLAVDLRARRKRSVQSMIGRAQLTPEQADKLLAGSNASRILDMLLTLPSNADRLACLPDCFTPPDNPGPDGDSSATSTSAAPSPVSDTDELVWCTPSQLLVELEARLQRLEGGGPTHPVPTSSAGTKFLGSTGAAFQTGENLIVELKLLRDAVRKTWLETLEVTK